MVVIGVVWFASQLLRQWVASVPLTAGIWLSDLWLLPLAFLLAGFPLARLENRIDRVLVGALAVVMLPLELLWLLVLDFDTFGGEGIPRNALMVVNEPGLADAIDTVQRVILVTSLGDAGDRARAPVPPASAPLRRVLAPVLAGAAGLALLATDYLLDKLDVRGRPVSRPRCSCCRRCRSSSSIGLLRARLARSAIGDLLVDLREPAEPGALRDALARALRDPTLELAYWVPEYDAYVGPGGEPVELPAEDSGRVDHVRRARRDARRRAGARRLAARRAAAGRRGDVGRRDRARERAPAGRSARAAQRPAGLARTDRRSRRHGAPQARARPPRRRAAAARLALDPAAAGRRQAAAGRPETRAAGHRPRRAEASLEELRGIAQGIHPAVLSDHGLPVALESLAARAPVRVALDVALDERLPQQIEVAAYYLVAEGLTNVAKYAEAESATIDVARENGTLVVEVADDGKGGADPDRGSGLRGLADRVEALDGRLRVWSPESGGTRLRAEIPCA